LELGMSGISLGQNNLKVKKTKEKLVKLMIQQIKTGFL
jgi:hypothetical protein